MTGRHWRIKHRITARAAKAAECLDASERHLIANALRLAADQYDADAVANDQEHLRLSEHFETMAEDCRLIAEAMT